MIEPTIKKMKLLLIFIVCALVGISQALTHSGGSAKMNSASAASHHMAAEKKAIASASKPIKDGSRVKRFFTPSPQDAIAKLQKAVKASAKGASKTKRFIPMGQLGAQLSQLAGKDPQAQAKLAEAMRHKRFIPQHTLNKLMFNNFNDAKEAPRTKRQFFGDQNAGNIQNNQFSGNSGRGGGMGGSGAFTGGAGAFTGGMGSGFGGGFGGAQASVHSGSTVMRAGSFRQKRQFFGDQNANSIQNNQFSG